MTTTESLSNCFEDYGFEVSSDMLAKCKSKHKLFAYFPSNYSSYFDFQVWSCASITLFWIQKTSLRTMLRSVWIILMVSSQRTSHWKNSNAKSSPITKLKRRCQATEIDRSIEIKLTNMSIMTMLTWMMEAMNCWKRTSVTHQRWAIIIILVISVQFFICRFCSRAFTTVCDVRVCA